MACITPSIFVHLISRGLVNRTETCCAESVRTKASYRNERAAAVAPVHCDIIELFAFQVVHRCRPRGRYASATVAEDCERRLHRALETEELVPCVIAFVAALADTIDRTEILSNTCGVVVFVTPGVFINLMLLRCIHGRIATGTQGVLPYTARRNEWAITFSRPCRVKLRTYAFT
jgi:hypothetical protein